MSALLDPFALHGGAFLAFYAVVGVAVNWGLRVWMRHREAQAHEARREQRGAPPQPTLTDPYQIAYLRAGSREALRVATVALLDRGLLDAGASTVQARGVFADEIVKRPVERALLRCFARPEEAKAAFGDAGAQAACRTYQKILADQGLLANGAVYAARSGPVLAAAAIVLGVGAVKISMALAEGRHNIGFLVVLTTAFTIFALTAWRKRLTGAGEAMLADLRRLFARLKARARTLAPGGATNEAALLAAVFGLKALPETNFPFMEKLYPKPKGGGDGGGSCGSSGSSCGSSCGGGGCGGGCGG